MFDLEWSKLALIAVVALVVIGPKDLPRVMRILGQWVQRARAIAREFQGSLDQMVREAELEDVKRDLDKVTNLNVEHEIGQTIDPRGELHRSLNDPVLSNPLIDPPKQETGRLAETTAEPATNEAKQEEAGPPHSPADAGPSHSPPGRGQG